MLSSRSASGSASLQWGPASFAGMCGSRAVARWEVSRCFNGARLRSPGCAAGSPARRQTRRRRFNGARLRSPGCADTHLLCQEGAVMLQWGPASFAGMCLEQRVPARYARELQWGPASFAGMCLSGSRGVGDALVASMGPGFVRRDVPGSMCLGGRHGCRFNGARLRSPGCAPRRS